MARIKQAVAWWCIKRNDVADEVLIAETARIGFKGIEMIPQELWPKVKDAGLTIVSEGGHDGISHGLNRRENHDRIEKEILAKLELAQKWGIPNLICFSGERQGLDDQRGLEVTIEGLNRVKTAAEQAGVTLVMELLNSKVDHADYQCDHTSWGAAATRAVNSPRVKLLYDIYHMQIMEGDIIRTLRDNIDQIGHFHTAGNPGRNELNDTQELNYRGIMNAIAATNYDRYVGQEFTPVGDRTSALEQAYKICDV